MGAPLGAGRPPPCSFIYGGRGTPKHIKISLSHVRCPLPQFTHLGHIVVVLRRSLEPVTSSSPSPRRRADGTHPRPQLDQEHEGRHRAECVLNAEVPYVRYLIGWIAKKFDYINCVIEMLPLSVYEGTWTHSPLSLLCISWIDLA